MKDKILKLLDANVFDSSDELYEARLMHNRANSSGDTRSRWRCKELLDHYEEKYKEAQEMKAWFLANTERFEAEIFKQREQVADFMLKHGFYTMHGDTVASLLDELGRQIVELRAKGDAVMSDGETEADYWHDVKEHRKSLRARLCVSCPGCPKIQPKRDPTILLPQQRCKVCGYRDIRKRED